MKYETLPDRIKKEIKVFRDGATIKIPLPDLGFHNMYDQGLGGTYLLANYFTLATYISTEVPNFMHKYLVDTGTYVYAVQTVLIIKPHFYAVALPFQCWDEFESIIDLVSFYRSTVITNQTIRIRETQTIIAQVAAKLITIDSATKRSCHIPTAFSEGFSKYFNHTHPNFTNVKSYLEMNRNMSRDILKSLLIESDTTREVFKTNVRLNESDHDWNHHVSNSMYVRICGDTLKQAIAQNSIFKKLYGPIKNTMMITRTDNSYLKECKAGDELKISCIVHISDPQKVEFRIFRLADVEEDTRIAYIGTMQIEPNRSKL